MTQHQQFEARVRERMARTGGSYTAARRHLVGDEPPSDLVHPGLLPGYAPARTVSQHDAALWSRVLGQAGALNPVTVAPFGEAMLAGLGGGIGFMVFTFEYRDVTTATVVTRFHPGPYRENLLARSGAEVRTLTTTSRGRARTALDTALEAGRPVVVRGDRALFAGEEPDEYGESADVVVAGRHPDGAFLVDTGTGLHEVEEERLAEARAARAADKHWQAHVEDPGSLDAPTLAAHVRTAVRETAEALLSTGGPAGVPAHFGKNFGVRGMRTWAERLRDTRTRKGWPALFDDDERRARALAQLQRFLGGDEWSGPGALRPLYARFLREAAAAPGLAALGELAGRYDALGRDWDALADVVDPDCGHEQRVAVFARMAGLLDGLADAEEAAATALLRSA
ncbi:DUF4872 domain-containing protein [Kocuria sp. M1R5S2]|uniref:DUF4872 domain-containing protein n=1 Tax=Kocuria rhizosphaerae TaxID=3376285 RepID=UPI0037AAE6A9